MIVTRATTHKKGLARLGLVLFYVSTLLLLIPLFPLLPQTASHFYLFETNFVNLNEVSIGNSEGVTQIFWSIWRACYRWDNKKTDLPTCTGLLGMFQPYGFIIIEDGNKEHVVVQKTWIAVLYLTCIVFFLAILIVMTILMTAVWKKYNYDEEIWDFQQSSCFLTVMALWMAFHAILVLAFVVCDSAIYWVIRNAMGSLGTGTITSVDTKPGPGYFLILAAGVIMILSCVFIISYINRKHHQVHDSPQNDSRDTSGTLKKSIYDKQIFSGTTNATYKGKSRATVVPDPINPLDSLEARVPQSSTWNADTNNNERMSRSSTQTADTNNNKQVVPYVPQ